MSWIEVVQNQTIATATPPDVTKYIVTTTISNAGGISKSMFVYAVSDDAFIGPASVRDLLAWPESKEEAIAADLDFYRSAECAMAFTTKERAAAFAEFILTRLSIFNRDWAGEQGAVFGGQAVFVYSSDTP